MSDEERLIKSYVWHGQKCYFVSTINRDSSAIDGPSRYAETMVWDFDWAKNERGILLHQGEDPSHCILTHIEICRTLFRGGIELLRKGGSDD